MTDTDTPRTTAPATLGDALTAEQIAAMHALNRTGRAGKLTYTVDCLIASHEALRDRLAQVEEREREAKPSVRYELVKENNDSADWDEGDFPPPYREWWMIYRYETVTKEQRDFGKMYFGEESARAALDALATPTDGAAPPRHDEGETP